MTYTKLIYGTLVAASLVGGTVWYLDSRRSTVKAIDAYTIVEKLAVRRAAAGLGGWPFANSVSTNVGWYATTNVIVSTNWSFNGYTVVPYFGSVLPRAFMNETLDQTTNLVRFYVDRVETNEEAVTLFGVTVTNRAPSFVMHTITGLWDRLNIGDGTSKWTVAFTTNGSPIYSNHIGSTICTTMLYEVDRVLNVFSNTVIDPGYYVRFLDNTNAFVTLSFATSSLPLAPEYPVAYSDSPANFFNYGWNEIYVLNNYFRVSENEVGFGLRVEGVARKGINVYDYARNDGTGTVLVASFPTNVTCTLNTWLLQDVIDLPYGESPVILQDIAYTHTNDVPFTGLDTNIIHVSTTPTSELGDWGAYLSGRGITITNYQSGFQYAVELKCMATWNFGD